MGRCPGGMGTNVPKFHAQIICLVSSRTEKFYKKKIILAIPFGFWRLNTVKVLCGIVISQHP